MAIFARWGSLEPKTLSSISVLFSLPLSLLEAGDSQVNVNAWVVQGESVGQSVSRGAPSVHWGVHNSPVSITMLFFPLFDSCSATVITENTEPFSSLKPGWVWMHLQNGMSCKLYFFPLSQEDRTGNRKGKPVMYSEILHSGMFTLGLSLILSVMLCVRHHCLQ